MTMSGTASDYKWQRVTTSGNEWQEMATAMSNGGWQRIVQQMKISEI